MTSAYDDVRAILDTVIDHSGEAYVASFPTPAAATAWRHRANKFRSKTEVPAYQSLSFSIKKESPCEVIITSRALPTLRTADGQELAIKTPEHGLSSIEAAAEELARELGLKK